MLNRNEKMHMAFAVAIALTVSGLFAGCSGCNDTAQDGAATTDQSTGAGGAGGADAHDASATGSGGADGGGDATHMDGRTPEVTGGTDVSSTPATPAEERTNTVEDMRGMRTVLVAELEQVRGRLKVAGRPDAESKADKTRAAELAQGLERLDRLIKKIDESDDVSWPTVRESSMSEAAEFRTWMAKYGMQVPA